MSDIPKIDDERYIGDGVYVTHDGHNLWLRTGDDESTQLQQIALEPEVFQSLVQYAKEFGDHFTGKMEVK